MKISVITPTVRDAGLALVEKALKRQTVAFEWIIGSPFKPDIDFPHKWVKDPGKNKGDYWSIYKTYNSMVREAKGELIVSVQDYTFFNPDTLERFWFHHTNEPKTLIGAVGNKYQDDTWKVETWRDPRIRSDFGSFYQCYFNDIEWNLNSCPREAIYAVGGFDEYLDKYSSLCGLDILSRLNVLGGYDFKLDQTIKSFSTEHGRLPNWEENEPFKGPWQERLKYYEKHPVLKCLTTV